MRRIPLVLAVLFAAALPAGAAPDEERLLFGMVPGNYYPGDIARDVKYFQLLRDAGVTHIGQGFNWDNIETKRGEYNWEPWDYAVDITVRNGIEPFGVIVGCPKWALPTSGDLGWMPVALNMPREDCIPDFEKFVETLARRYAGKVRRWEFWNEPNGYNMAPTVGENDPKYAGKIAKYTKYLKLAHAALVKGDPQARMACGGMDSGGATGTWLKGLYANGAKGSMDAVDIHPYTNNPPFFDEAYLKKTRAIMDENGDQDLPVWINEYGVYNPGKDFFQTAIKAVEEKYPYVTMLTYHSFKDFRGEDGVQPWGLIDRELNIKPSGGYASFKSYPKPPRKNPPAAPSGPCSIAGMLTDAQLKQPVADCIVIAMPGVFFTKTDARGAFTLASMPEGSYHVTCRPPGFDRVPPVEVTVTAAAPGRADITLSRDAFPPGENEDFDAALDRADRKRGNLAANGSFDKMDATPIGPIATGWAPFNTTPAMAFAPGAGVGGAGLSQGLGLDGRAWREGVEQTVKTEPGKKYRLVFWFAYAGDGSGDGGPAARFGLDPEGGDWKHESPGGGKPKYGFPKSIEWERVDLVKKCDARAGGPGQGAKHWYRFTKEFTAAGPAASIWLEGSGAEGKSGRRFFDEMYVVAADE